MGSCNTLAYTTKIFEGNSKLYWFVSQNAKKTRSLQLSQTAIAPTSITLTAIEPNGAFLSLAGLYMVQFGCLISLWKDYYHTVILPPTYTKSDKVVCVQIFISQKP